MDYCLKIFKIDEFKGRGKKSRRERKKKTKEVV